MELATFADPASFLGAVEPTLLEREAEHSLLLGSAAALRGDEGERPWLAVVRDGARLAAAAMLGGSRPLLLDGDREDIGEAAARIADGLAAAGLAPAAVHGRERHAGRFARCWSERTGASVAIAMRQRLHALSETRRVPLPPGGLRAARADDAPLLVDWSVDFKREAIGEADSERLRASALRRLAAGEVYVWEDGAPRAMAATARPTRHTIAINSVYTPPEQRGRGYATGCVALLSERMLAAGRAACVLFTDLANPTSNAIYARIGYAPVADFVLLRFA